MSATEVEKGVAAAADGAAALPQDNNNAAKSAEAAAADAAALSAAEGRRLYVGNLAYAASEEQIKEFFKGFSVEAVTIPKNPRTDKAVGYAFVDLASADESERAIAELAGKEVLERKVSVQIAHKPEPAAEKKEGDDGAKRNGKSPRSRGRSGRGRGRNAEDGGDNGAAAAATPSAVDGAAPPPAAAEQHKAASEAKKPRAPSAKRERGPPADGVPSKTKVMVANLPYDLSEDKLKELFAAYEPLSAKIALRPIPRFMVKKLQARGEPRKGRGFGFVSLPSEEVQQKVVAEMNGKMIDGREIAVKVAVDSPDKTDEALAAKAANALNLNAGAEEGADKPAEAAAAPA